MCERQTLSVMPGVNGVLSNAYEPGALMRWSNKAGTPKSHNGRTVAHPLQALGSTSSTSVSSALVPVTESQDRQPWTTSAASRAHVPRLFGRGGHPCPAEPKMGDLRKSLPPLRGEATPHECLLIIPRMKYGGHVLKKFPLRPPRIPDERMAGCAR